MVPMLALLSWLLNAQANQAMDARMNATRQHGEVAHGVVVRAQSLGASGSTSHDQAQQLVLHAIEKLRYDGAEYPRINDMQARMVMTAMAQLSPPQCTAFSQDSCGSPTRPRGCTLVTMQLPSNSPDQAQQVALDPTTSVSALLRMPEDAIACYVLAPGAGAGMANPLLRAVANGLAARRIATL